MSTTRTDRICRFEWMEPRQLLAADPLLGNLLQAEPIEAVQAISDDATGSVGAPGSIAGRVRVSEDSNCSQHENVSGLAGVTIFLLDETGGIVDETLTDTEGEYQFSNLLPGIYAVQEVQPADYFEGNARIGNGGGQRFNDNLLGEITVGAGDTLIDYDFCDYRTDPLDESDGPIDRRLDSHGSPPAEVVEAVRTNVFLELPQSPQPLGGTQGFLAPTTFIATAAIPSQPATSLSLLSPLEISARTPKDIRQLSSTEANSTEVEQRTDFLDSDSPFSTGTFLAGDIAGNAKGNIRWMLSGFDPLAPTAHYQKADASLPSEPTAAEDDWISNLATSGPWNPDEVWRHLGEEETSPIEEAGDSAKTFLWLTAELL